jgi:hypothetical protein
MMSPLTELSASLRSNVGFEGKVIGGLLNGLYIKAL